MVNLPIFEATMGVQTMGLFPMLLYATMGVIPHYATMVFPIVALPLML
jgi:hypothetical protein